MNLNIGNDWDEILNAETDKPYFRDIQHFLDVEYVSKTVYPPRERIYAALKYVPFSDVKVVIVGQDPYKNYGQANGLAFAVSDGTKLPPSLVNIYKEMETDLGVDMHGKSGELTGWAKQGVLLLNATLTVLEGNSNAHSMCGWQTFTDSIIKMLGKRKKPMVFILWGRNAQMKEKYIEPQHYIIKSAHPSPLSAYNGFFGSKPFSKTNKFLVSQGETPIEWDRVTIDKEPSYYHGTGSITRG